MELAESIHGTAVPPAMAAAGGMGRWHRNTLGAELRPMQSYCRCSAERLASVLKTFNPIEYGSFTNGRYNSCTVAARPKQTPEPTQVSPIQ
jgi:hypothetical protein